jgi:endonuclease-8
MDATIASSNGRMGQTNQKGTFLEGPNPDAVVLDTAGENSLHSIGAPRRTRLRMSESEKEQNGFETFPPEPVGQVRVRLLTDTVVADLRGPTACEVLDPAQVEQVVARLGPDPLLDDGPDAEERFASVIRRKPTPIGLLLMDQNVVSGIGNVYRAELLFRHGVSPFRPGRGIDAALWAAMWADLVTLMRAGVRMGRIVTTRPADRPRRRGAIPVEDARYVYRRTGLPCRLCGTGVRTEIMVGRNLYWCPVCQSA